MMPCSKCWSSVTVVSTLSDTNVGLGVGKSSILVRLIENAFHENHNVTIGVEFGNYVMRVDNKHVI